MLIQSDFSMENWIIQRGDSTPAFGIQVLRAAYITLISPAPSYLGAKITCEEHYVIISKRETQEIQVFVLDNLPPY